MKIFRMLLVMVLGLLSVATLSAQTCDLQFNQVTNNGTNYDVTVQIRASSAFNLGSSNFRFSYNTTDLSNPVLLSAANFSGGNYSTMTVSSNPPVVSVNIALNVVSSGTAVSTSYMDVGTIRFTTVNKNGASNLTWFSSSATPVASRIFKDDESTLISTNALGNLNTSPLPIQMSSFVATNTAAGVATLHWTTVSEINNYGFTVQKAVNSAAAFQDIEGAFVAGNGTSLVKHDYGYTDRAYVSGNVYRLKQADLTGDVHYTDAIDPLGVTGVAIKPMPTEYSLSQNYPNPFNPSTTIEFALPQDSHVLLEVYNVIGQKVMTLVNEVRQAGYHQVRLDGTNLASGLYLYRLTTGNKAFMKKFVLMK